MKMRILTLVAAIACCSVAFAEDAKTSKPQFLLDPAQFPPPAEMFLRDQSMPAVAAKETTQAVNGLLYNVIAPIFDGSDGNVSFIRLGNANNFPITYTVLVVGNSTGKLYGSTTYPVAAYASPQLGYNQILQKAGVLGLTGSDTGYAFYIRTGQFYTGYQHVIFNLDSKFFENASLCTFADDLPYSPLNQVLVDIHTQIVASAGFPAILFIHNYSSSTVTYRGFVFESETGAAKGSIVTTLGPNQSSVFPFSDVEKAINWTPVGLEGHANMIWQRADGAAFTAVIGQSVFNQTFQAYANMSIACPVNN